MQKGIIDKKRRQNKRASRKTQSSHIDYSQLNFESGHYIFFGGVSKSIRKKDLICHFSQFGPIESIIIDIVPKAVKVANVGAVSIYSPSLHRGSGFVKFKCPKHAAKAAVAPFHSIDGQVADVRLPMPIKEKIVDQRMIRVEKRKVIFKGVPRSMSSSQVYQIFQRFGTVKRFNWVFDDYDREPQFSVIYKEEMIGESIFGKSIDIEEMNFTLKIMEPKSTKQVKAEKKAIQLRNQANNNVQGSLPRFNREPIQRSIINNMKNACLREKISNLMKVNKI